MSIKETLEKIKPFYNLLLLVVFCSIFFALGRLSYQNSLKISQNSIKITQINDPLVAQVINTANNTENSTGSITNQATTSQTNTNAEVIGSKSGKKYYFPWCGTVKRIKPENQVKFRNIDEAKKAGFTPGGNCKGLY